MSRTERTGAEARPTGFDASAIDLVVFDWDGTVVDSIAVIATSIQNAARDLGLRVPDDTQARHVIGLGLADALRMAVPDLRTDQVEAFTGRYRHHFFAAPDVDRPFDGMPELIAALAGRGLTLAVATGKSRRGLDRALAQTGLGRWFTLTRCGEEGDPKPHPWMLQDLSDCLRIARHRTVMIGDTTHDIGMARAFGCASIGVLYGAHEPGALETSGADALVGSVDELARVLAPAGRQRHAGAP